MSSNRLEAMKRMAASNVLVVGVQGLGVEIGRVASCQALQYIDDFLYSEEHCARWC